MTSADVIKLLKRDGWMLRNVKGSHHHFTHPTKLGLVTVPHPRKNIYTWLLRSIYRQTGWNWRDR